MGRAEDLYAELVRDGGAAIDRFIADRIAEELFLDFKRSGDNSAGAKLHDSDRTNLAKAISGFGNSEGGVLIWGVECKDLPTGKYPIKDPHLFVSRLQGAVSGCTVPPHSMVRHHPIVVPGQAEGFAATLIPKSDHAPHQALRPGLQYYIRAGSDFVPTPHAVLAGMFGRRPSSGIHHVWGILPTELSGNTLSVALGIQLATNGPGVIRDMYVSIMTSPRYSKYFAGYEVADRSNWSGHHGLGSIFSLVSNGEYRLAPGTLIEPVKVRLLFAPPFETTFSCDITYGHGTSPVLKIVCELTASELQQLHSDTVAHLNNGENQWHTPILRAIVDKFNASLPQ